MCVCVLRRNAWGKSVASTRRRFSLFLSFRHESLEHQFSQSLCRRVTVIKIFRIEICAQAHAQSWDEMERHSNDNICAIHKCFTRRAYVWCVVCVWVVVLRNEFASLESFLFWFLLRRRAHTMFRWLYSVFVLSLRWCTGHMARCVSFYFIFFRFISFFRYFYFCYHLIVPTWI